MKFTNTSLIITLKIVMESLHSKRQTKQNKHKEYLKL